MIFLKEEYGNMNDQEKCGSFATGVGCIDGRTVEPILAWARKHLDIQWVDIVPRPGMDGFLISDMDPVILKDLQWQVSVSLEKHKSKYILVSGHCECAGNPVSKEEHRRCVALACEVVRLWQLPPGIKVIGLLVNAEWHVEKISDLNF